MTRAPCRRILALILSAVLQLSSTSLLAQPLLRCGVTYAGTTQIIEQHLLHDLNTDDLADTGGAYTQPASDIAGRFLFKSILLGRGRALEVIKIYVYYQAERPVLIQETKLLPPFRISTTPNGLTGLQFVHAGPLERELQYGCALLEEKA